MRDVSWKFNIELTFNEPTTAQKRDLLARDGESCPFTPADTEDKTDDGATDADKAEPGKAADTSKAGETPSPNSDDNKPAPPTPTSMTDKDPHTHECATTSSHGNKDVDITRVVEAAWDFCTSHATSKTYDSTFQAVETQGWYAGQSYNSDSKKDDHINMGIKAIPNCIPPDNKWMPDDPLPKRRWADRFFQFTIFGGDNPMAEEHYPDQDENGKYKFLPSKRSWLDRLLRRRRAAPVAVPPAPAKVEEEDTSIEANATVSDLVRRARDSCSYGTDPADNCNKGPGRYACFDLLFDNYRKCSNGGRGGKVVAGCFEYSLTAQY